MIDTMRTQPLIDIIVPTYNRPQDIKRFIEEIEKQTYKNFKVYIIDDAGSIPIDQLIPRTKQFIFEKLKTNRGQAFARNYAASKGKGEIIIFMDDDAWFTKPFHLSLIENYFKENPTAGCLMFDIQEPNRPILSERKKLKDKQELGDFIACGCAFTREAFHSTNGFSSIFHSYGEETDIAIQLIKNGYKIIFSKNILVHHNYIPENRTIEWKKRFIRNSVRNDLLIVAFRFPCILVLPFLILKFFSHLRYHLIKEKIISYTFQGLISFLKIIFIPTIKNKRNPMSLSQFNYWFKIRM